MVYLKGIIKKHKLLLSYLLIILLFFSFGIFTINGIVTVGDLTKMIYDHPLVVSNASLNAGLNIAKMHRSMKDVALANVSWGSQPQMIEIEKAKARVRLLPLLVRIAAGTPERQLAATP